MALMVKTNLLFNTLITRKTGKSFPIYACKIVFIMSGADDLPLKIDDLILLYNA